MLSSIREGSNRSISTAKSLSKLMSKSVDYSIHLLCKNHCYFLNKKRDKDYDMSCLQNNYFVIDSKNSFLKNKKQINK